MRNFVIIFIALIILFGTGVQLLTKPAYRGVRADRKDFAVIKNLVSDKNFNDAEKECYAFLKTWPESRLVPDVRLVLADIESSPEDAVKKYRTVVDLYRYFPRRDQALCRLCEILYLQSKWNELAESAREGTGYPKSINACRFRYFLIIALMHLGKYGAAEEECRAAIDKNHDYHNLARSLLMLAHIYKATSGMSRSYIRTIREIAMGYGESDALPATLFLLGEFYEQKKLHDESYSAYSDLVAKYPNSPEAVEALKKMRLLARHNPHYVFYLPDKTIVDKTEHIEIHPEISLPDNEVQEQSYSISVGPFPSAKRAAELRELLKDFDGITTVRLNKGFSLYVGRCSNEETALKLRIRLAEEYGINGRIVRISSDGRRSYIYGE
ncbi:MAG: hypothetical protein JW807_12410 [Spirochaetes bacterium]|nr:hypothetical protein [Spirochaetota bacterium]